MSRKAFVGGLFVAILALAGEVRAGLSIGVSVDYPNPLMVGQRVTGSLLITNASTQPEDAGVVFVYAIRLVPACKSTEAPCPSDAREAFVFQVSSTASGTTLAANDSACSGLTFDVSARPDSQLLFVPTGATADAAIVLQPPGSAAEACRINFELDVIGLPTDVVTFLPFIQTKGVVSAKATSGVTELTVTAVSSGETTVLPSSPQATGRESDGALSAGAQANRQSASAAEDKSGQRSSNVADATPPASTQVEESLRPTPTASPKTGSGAASVAR